mmetsp:Transcript_7389/g.16213  ORF Transcript_7389/g.16213 Transcript_7389/m.16213 type:complete len:460 (+) Transcript_7389:156-1535(+)|eukprot:CAMPEP_0178382422 /NCGR_PEP_ID=MMETSP0689_2-20121128/6484_1 /TAXON_ID=160604 /ORGANISM="Amphidinium massartii, Strain CS-259" /LENGTH=459 /DNA_ID=CAMNT_0020002623 /DNA_START=70 /DNA_END=1449 /DNA_ORIENTATION=-
MPSFAGAEEGSLLFSTGSDALGVLAFHRFLALTIGVLVLGCLHYLLYDLRTVLVPFALSTFIVLTIQPTVELLYELLAGRRRPYRWFGCCLVRRRRRGDGTTAVPLEDLESFREAEALLDTSPGNAGLDDLFVAFCDGLCRLAAITIIGTIFVVFVFMCGSLLVHSALNMKDHWQAYHTGLQRAKDAFDGATDWVEAHLHVNSKTGDWIKDLNMKLNASLNNAALSALDATASAVSGSITFLVILLLYILFWLLQPLPMTGHASMLIRGYVWKKTVSSLALGTCVTVYFMLLGVDLAVVFGLVTCCLNFVPEVGAFVSMILPVPVIVLDSRLSSPLLTLALASGGQLVLKFIFGNCLEVKLIEMDQEASIHPVWVILGLNYFGYIWGPTGMLISVPLLAVLKSIALALSASDSEEVAQSAEFLFLCLEGRRKESKVIARRMSRRRAAASGSTPVGSDMG